MTINNLLKDFFEGKIKLWKAFWLVGLVHSFALFFIIPIFEKNILNNSEIYVFVQINQETFELPDFTKLSFISKLLVILSTLYVTIGIWRSCEKYNGSLFWIIIVFIYLSFNNIIPTIYLVLYLFIISSTIFINKISN